MKYYIIAGEASGDLLGSYLMAEIKRNDLKRTFSLGEATLWKRKAER